MFRRFAAAFVSVSIVICLCVNANFINVGAEEDEATVYGELWTKIYSALCDHDAKIEFESGEVSRDTFFSCVSDIVCSSPFLFYFDGKIDYTTDKNGYILSAVPHYSMGKEEAEGAIEFCRSEIERIVFMCEEDMSEYEKVLFFHDHLCKNYEYDLTLKSNNMYSFLMQGKGNCMAYTQTYIALLRMLDIEVGYAASNEMEHIWNVVQLDGRWYHVDLTWDDLPNKRFVHVSHLQFLFGDEMAISLGYSGWDTGRGIVCSADHESYKFISAIIGSIERYCGEYYYCDGAINKIDFNGLTSAKVEGSEGAACMSLCGGKLLYGRGGEIYSLEGDLVAKASGGICGFRERDGRIEYAIADFANGRSVYKNIELPFGFLGDADGDGKIGVGDLLTVGSYMSGEPFQGASLVKSAADINADGRIEYEDVALLRRLIVETEEGF